MFLVGYFGTFNLNFDFLKKKYLGHPKMTKIFFFAPINTFHQHLEFFNYHVKQKAIAIEVGLQDINIIEGKT